MIGLGLRGTTFVVDAPGTIADCVSRLNGRLDRSPTWEVISPRRREFRGRALSGDVVVAAVGPSELGGRPIWHQWTPVFRGRFVAVEGGTARLEGRIKVNVFVPAFTILMAIILAGWLSAGIPYLIARMQEGSPIGLPTLFTNLIMPMLFASVLLAINWYGGRLYERDRHELEAFLIEALGLAKPDVMAQSTRN